MRFKQISCLVFRAVMGFGVITFVLIGPAIVADLVPRERRGLALSVMSTGPVIVSNGKILNVGRI